MSGAPAAGAAPPRPLRSALYVPATRPELLAKALASAADAVIVDLEDAVAAQRKDEARVLAAEALAALCAGGARPPKPVQVRINAVGTPHAEADAAMLAALPAGTVSAVRIPKAESAAQVQQVEEWVGPGPGLWCLIESAIGVERALQIATAAPRVCALGLGEADLRASLRLPAGVGDAGLAYARSRIVMAARAAGLPSPLQSVYTDVHDLEGLRRSCAEGRALGFGGRNCVHPAQVEVINEAFTPTQEELVRAREIVAALEGAEETGAGAVALPDGRFVDLAVVEQARATLAAAGEQA